MSMTSCLNLILDEEHAVKLSHLAERTHARPTTIQLYESGPAVKLGTLFWFGSGASRTLG